jgi:hypothetical protein
VVAFLAISASSAIWCAFLPPGWLRRLAERIDAKAFPRPLGVLGSAKGSQA